MLADEGDFNFLMKLWTQMRSWAEAGVEVGRREDWMAQSHVWVETRSPFFTSLPLLAWGIRHAQNSSPFMKVNEIPLTVIWLLG